MDLILWRHAEAEDGSADEVQLTPDKLVIAKAPPDAELPGSKSISSYALGLNTADFNPLDLDRSLTPRGEKQALRMAAWLDRQLPEGTRVWVSPARRCEQTALALGRKYKVRPELAPNATPEQLLELVQWPAHKYPVLVIGHQPVLGQTIAQLLGLKESECAVKKGAIWWLRHRERDGQSQTVIVTVQSPEVL